MEPKQAKQLRLQLQKAVRALLKHGEVVRSKSGKKASLLEESEFISVQFTLRKTPDQGKNKAIRVEIPNTLYNPDDGYQMCLFVKDKDSATLRERFEKTPVNGLSKVIGLQKLRTDYNRFQDKKKLCSSYDLFLTDDSILPMMTKALGKEFFKKKKQPAAVRLTVKSLRKEIRRARDATYMFLGYGTCISIRAARTSFSEDEIVDNIMSVVEHASEKIPKKWKNIASILIKTPQSIALPVYNKLVDPEDTIIEIIPEKNGSSKKSNSKKKLSQLVKKKKRKAAKPEGSSSPAKKPKRK
jgi:ribosome biogenesis protein UTP30